MTPDRRQLLREQILVAAQASAPAGVTLRILTNNLRPAGFGDVPQSTFDAEVAYLVDKGLLRPLAKAISPEIRAWTITANGTDHLATAGLTPLT